MNESTQKRINDLMFVFLDQIGRTVIGLKIEETPETVRIENPLIVFVDEQKPQPIVDERGQMVIDPATGRPRMSGGGVAIRFYPLLFREFVGDQSAPTIWTYNKSNITPADKMVLDFRIYAQYFNMYYKQNDEQASPPPPQSVVNGELVDPKEPIKLF